MLNIYTHKNSQSHLVDFFKFSNKFNIIDKPITYLYNDKISSNYDVVLILDGTGIDEKLLEFNILNKPIIGIQRWDKQYQMMHLIKNGINVPPTYFAENFESSNGIVGLMQGSGEDNYVIKISAGAKGLGQALLSKIDLINLFESNKEEIEYAIKQSSPASSKENYKIAVVEAKTAPVPVPSYAREEPSVSHQNETLKQYEKLKNIKWNTHDYLLNAIINRKDFIIQKYLKNRIEWRLLWFYDNKPIIVKRNRDKNSWQANACNNDYGSSKYLESPEEIGEFNYLVDIDKITTVFNEMKVPFMSIDVYYDNDTKQWGIFEFQMEFGWTNTLNMPYDVIREQILDSTHKLISKTIIT